jgi:putative acetyltransferase
VQRLAARDLPLQNAFSKAAKLALAGWSFVYKDMDMSTVEIRHSEPEDYLAYHRILAHPLVYRDTLQIPFPSLDLWSKKTKELPVGMHRLVACVDEGVVGFLHVEVKQAARRHHAAEFAIAVDPAHFGQGVGSALMTAMIDLCDNWLNLHRIELTVFVDNAAAIALYRKFGFEIEGTSRDFAFREGRYVDVHHMGRIRPDVQK